jgi:hypothetical protein
MIFETDPPGPLRSNVNGPDFASSRSPSYSSARESSSPPTVSFSDAGSSRSP